MRPEVLASWERSLAAGVTDVDPPFVEDFDTESRFLRAARPVVDRLESRLAGTSACIFLTDPDTLIVDRRLADHGVARRLTEISSAPGFSFAEDAVGTNGAAIVADGGGPNFVLGAEHFPGELHYLSCFAAPVRDRVTGELAGVFDITLPYADTSDMIMPIVLQAADDIATRLGEDSTRSQRVLLEAFSRANLRSSRPMLAVDGSMMMSNRAGSQVLGPIDQQALWDAVRRSLRDQRSPSWFPLVAGEPVLARCRAVLDGGAVVGAIVHLRRAQEPATPAEAPAPRLADTVGSGRAWRNVVAQVRDAAACGRPALILGQPGTGKLTLAKALLALAGSVPLRPAAPGTTASAAPPRIVDCVEPDAQSDLRALADGDPESAGVIVRHLDAIAQWDDADFAALVANLAEAGWRVVGTLRGEIGPDPGPTVVALAARTIRAPSLVERAEDIPELVRSILRADGRRDFARTTPEATRALTRYTWPGNITQLETVLRRFAADDAYPTIDVRDLPDPVRTAVHGRTLSTMERVEVDTLQLALREHGGARGAAAEMLGISRSTLYRKLKVYRIDPEQFRRSR